MNEDEVVKQLEEALNNLSMKGWSIVIYPEKLPTFEHSFMIVARHPRYKYLAKDSTLAELQKRSIYMALAKTNNHMTNTAKLLGITKSTLYRKLRSYGYEFRNKAPRLIGVKKPTEVAEGE